MVTKSHRLGGLQMGKSWHHRGRMFPGAYGQNMLQTGERAVRFIQPVADIQLEIRRHLIIARAGRVQPPGRLADQLL